MPPFAIIAPLLPPTVTLAIMTTISLNALLVELVPLDAGPRVRGPPAALEPPDAQRRALGLRLPAPEAVGDAPAVDFDAL